MSPSSVDLPLPDAPTIATNCPFGMVMVSGWRMVSGCVPLVTVLETSRSSIIRAHDRPQRAPDRFGNFLRAGGGRMNAVALVQFRQPGHAVEEERE